MNLNFYNPSNQGYLESLQQSINDYTNKLNQLKDITLGTNNNNISSSLDPRHYYLDCGIKDDWDQFLKINYNLNEAQMFEDYKLFLQAKMELHKDTDKEKLEAMKQKLSASSRDKGLKEQVIPNANDTTNVGNQRSNNVHKQQMAINTNNIQEKGDKHVR